MWVWGSRLNSLLTQQTSIKKVLLQQAVMQTLALQSRLIAPDSAKSFCFYTARSSEGAVTSLEQALEMAVWAKGAKNCHFLRTSWSSRPPSPSLHNYQGVCPSPSPTATFKDCPNWPWEEIKCGPASGVWPELRVPQPAACRGTVGLLRTRDTMPLTSPSLQDPIAHIQGISLFSPGLLPKRVGVPLSQMNPANSCINPYAEARTASSAPEDSGHIQPGFRLKPNYTRGFLSRFPTWIAAACSPPYEGCRDSWGPLQAGHMHGGEGKWCAQLNSSSSP